MADDNQNRQNEEERRRQKSHIDRLQESMQAISQEIFGVSGAAFFDKIERSSETMAALAERARETNEHLAATKIAWAEELRGSLGSSLGEANSIVESMDLMNTSFQNLTATQLNEFQNALGSIGDDDLQEILDHFDRLEDKYTVLNALAQDNINGLATLPDHIRNSVSEMAILVTGTNDLAEINEDVVNRQREHNAALRDANTTTKEGINIMSGLYEMSENFRQLAIKTTYEWDKVANSVQSESGIMLSRLGEGEGLLGSFSTRAADLTSNMAQFGMTLEDIGKFIGEIGEEMRTTNTVSADLAQQFAAISMATGISTKEVAELGGNLLKMGRSAENVYEYFEDTNAEARALGVNSRRVLQAINKNMVRMQSFGFKGGEESLTRMALRAEQLRIEIDDIFDVADRARTIEGAMEMAAQLQLAGGSFSNVNVGSLLDAARNDPKELQRMLAQMGSDIGKVKEDGTFDIDAIDRDRLEIVAEATGMKYESLFEMIRRNAIDTAKVGDVFSDSFFAKAADGIDSMDAAMAKSAFSDLLEMKDGEFVLNKDGQKLLDTDDVKDWKNLTHQELAAIMNAREKEALSLEEQARENMDMRKSMDSLVASIANTMTVFQPILESITGVINWINEETGLIGKGIAAAIIGGLSIIGPILMKGFVMSKMGRFFGGAGKGLTGLGVGISNASNAIANVSTKSILKFGLALGIIGTALVGFSAAMAEWGGEASLAQMGTAAGSLVLLAGGVLLFSQVAGKISLKDVGIATLAMLGVSVGIGVFGMAAQQMNGVDWGSVLAGLGVMALALLAMIGIGALMMLPGVALLAGVGMLTLIGIALGLAAAGALLASAAGNFNKLADIDWTGFSKMGGALMAAAPGMFAFGLAAMVFANPIAMLGMLAMTGQLALLGAVMNPLAENMQRAADSMEKFVSQMDNLKSVVKELDTGKLEEISEMAENMSKASRNNAISSLASSIKDMFTGGGGRGTASNDRPREIKIRLYLPNGRELQSQIIEDTGLQSGR